MKTTHILHICARLWRDRSLAALAMAALTLQNAWAAPIAQQAYLKASNTGGALSADQPGDNFGRAVALSGNTMVVTALNEDSNTTGVDGNQSDNSATDSGAAYVFVRSGTNWIQQAYLKASNTEAGDHFGHSVAISGDTVVVGANQESSNATGVNGNQSDNSALNSGAAYVFVRSGTNWTQQAYLKASNTGAGDTFGFSVGVSGDTVVVGAPNEDSNAKGVNGNQSNNSATDFGAAYVFARSGTNWTQQAYLKASTGTDGNFGISAALSGDTAVIGAWGGEVPSALGSAFVFVRQGTNWIQQAQLKASNPGAEDGFGGPGAVAISGDTVVVGAQSEDSNASGVNGNQNNNNAQDTGAAYIFVRNGTNWTQQAYLKASNPGAGVFLTADLFGGSVAVSGDTVVISSALEDSHATGVNGDQSDNSATDSGAAYVFVRSGTNWTQQAYLKASNTGVGDRFGASGSVVVSGDAVVVGALDEDNNATGVNGNQSDNSAMDSGAVYVFTGLNSVNRLALVPDGSNGYLIRFDGIPNLTYRLQRASSIDGPWDTIDTQTAPASGLIDHHETSPLPGAAFYRAITP